MMPLEDGGRDENYAATNQGMSGPTRAGEGKKGAFLSGFQKKHGQTNTLILDFLTIEP